MIAKNLLTKMPAPLKMLHFCINDHLVRRDNGLNWVEVYNQRFSERDWSDYHKVSPVLRLRSLMHIYLCYDKLVFTGRVKDFTVKHPYRDSYLHQMADDLTSAAQELVKHSTQYPDSDPYQVVITDTILAANCAVDFLNACLSGKKANWYTLEIAQD